MFFNSLTSQPYTRVWSTQIITTTIELDQSSLRKGPVWETSLYNNYVGNIYSFLNVLYNSYNMLNYVILYILLTATVLLQLLNITIKLKCYVYTLTIQNIQY